MPGDATVHDELDDSPTTTSDNGELPADMEKPAGFVDDASADGGESIVSSREDHAGVLHSFLNDTASGAFGTEKPVHGLTDNLTATVDPSTAVHEPDAVPMGMLFNTVKVYPPSSQSSEIALCCALVCFVSTLFNVRVDPLCMDLRHYRTPSSTGMIPLHFMYLKWVVY
jgi:hypothetical protein